MQWHLNRRGPTRLLIILEDIVRPRIDIEDRAVVAVGLILQVIHGDRMQIIRLAHSIAATVILRLVYRVDALHGFDGR